jgi:zinc D-Ala-D-Ala carboxypeptidase
MNWTDIKHFKPEEFDSPDAPGSGCQMQDQFVRMLDYCRGLADFAFHITSGFRTLQHNRDIEGKPHSAHIEGWAADILVRTSSERWMLVWAAMEVGINRIGVGSNFIHLDCHPDLPRNVIWTY